MVKNSRSLNKQGWPATGWEPDSCSESEVPVPVENPVGLWVDDKLLVTLYCTPDHLDELACGFLLDRGLVASLSDIAGCEPDAGQGRVDIRLKQPLNPSAVPVHETVIYSGCGQGATIAAETDNLPAVVSGITFKAAILRDGLSKTLSRGKIYRETHGAHSAGICSRRGGVLVLREDIGRHNALDKVLGWAAARCLDPGIVFVAASGRVSAEAVDKLARFGIPVMVSKGKPTTLALTRADDLGITLASGLGSRKLNIYTHGERVET